MAFLHPARGQFNPFDLYAKDARSFRAAGIRPIAALEAYGIFTASDALDWRPCDLLRIPNVGKATVAKLVALIELA